jgi:non-ribosomal peptide synthetase-like protein
LTLLRADRASPPRTLVEILQSTTEAHPDAAAIDSGAEVLTYTELMERAVGLASLLGDLGVGRGGRVGVRIRSGTTELYVAIAAVLVAGAAYVPVDADDPDERATTVFSEANVDAVIRDGLSIERLPNPGAAAPAVPDPSDDAWIIFTSGSTGKPKGVAVTHRSAAAFVDAEARLFLQGDPLGPGDRVMAGLSVGFDASCEEIWLAWAYGACLVPAPRSLVRSGMDLGPWLMANDVTVVSTVPTLVSLWPMKALDKVRLLILGGEACPPEIGDRLATGDREVWNTYGPTEATVVSCGARMTGEGPVRIGLPLDGWDLAVVDAAGAPVGPGGTGELIIGGVGLARYLDTDMDRERFASMPRLGWDRAYRSGDLVRNDAEGLVFLGRADDQVKLGGRRIELGEIDSALLALPGVTGAAAAVRTTRSGNRVLVGYVATGPGFDARAAVGRLRATMPGPLVPRLVVVDTLQTRTSGKVDREALPWPATSVGSGTRLKLDGTAAWVHELWTDLLGAEVDDPDADFFDLGGSSLTAAQLVSRLRSRFPEITVADIYETPALGALAAALDAMDSPAVVADRTVSPVPVKTQLGQAVFTVPLRTLTGLRWLVWTAVAANVARPWWGLDWLPGSSLWLIAVGWFLLVSPPGRLAIAAAGARWILRDVRPGAYPRGGRTHLRIWLAERLADEAGVLNLAGAPALKVYARALGATVGNDVDLHSVPPVTGLLSLGAGCSVEAEVDLAGHWLDGDVLHVGQITIGKKARIGTRSTLGPGATVGAGAEVGAGSAVVGEIPAGEYWSGAPALPAGHARGPWSDTVPQNRARWILAYAASAVFISLLPLVAAFCGLLAVLPWMRGTTSMRDAWWVAVATLPIATVVGFMVLALLVVGCTRLWAIGLESGHHPVHGRSAWQAWSTLRLLDESRSWLYAIYASSMTPLWLRALGAEIGDEVEASTVLLIPKLTSVNDGAFLADDTLLGGYELGGGWLRIDEVKIGKHAFLGNSGMAAPGRKVPKRGLVAVLSAAPRRTKAKAGMSWIGSPPTKLRRSAGDVDQTRTYHPATRLKVARALVELCRLVPVMVNLVLVLAAAALMLELWLHLGWWVAALFSGLVLMGVGALGAGIATLAKWALVGRIKVTEHPLWSSFVWRNELADAFVELIAAPWFARPATGTWMLNVWFRSLGSRVGRGVWCETYWLPEADLVELEDGVTVNRGCVVQTHLFHDRMMSMDVVSLRAGSTLGPNSVILPAAVLGKHATVGPVSLVMRGESVPSKTRWIGNPIGPWVDSFEVSADGTPR